MFPRSPLLKERELTMKPGIILQTLRPTDHVDSAGDTGMLFNVTTTPPFLNKNYIEKKFQTDLSQSESKKFLIKFLVCDA